MRVVVALLPLLLAGCYLLRQASGQFQVLAESRNLPDMLRDPAVPNRTKARLRLVKEIKRFAEDHMGLTRSSNYTSFYDTGGKPITYLVSACRKDRFEPYTWWFPIVGTVPYKGFFDREDAREEARELDAEGLDVVLGGAAAYSTLGYFSDPVLSTMVDQPAEQFVSLILHELTHGTLYVPGDTTFNEGLASFVGWQGALEFARWRYGIDSPEYDRTVQAFAGEELRDARAKEVFGKLNKLYRSDLPPDRKIELRDDVAGGPVNNARILMQRRYGRYDEFRAIFEQVDGNWSRFFERVRGFRPQR